MKKYFLYIIVFLCSACSVSKIAVPIVTQADIDISNHILTNDITGLITDCQKYPAKKQSICDYLIYETNYSKCSYESLKQYEQLITFDSTLLLFYMDLREDKELAILDHLSKMNLAEIMDYYREHKDEQFFIQNNLESDLYNYVNKADYAFVRYAHESAKNTSFSPYIDSIWNLRRNKLLPLVKESTQQYCDLECQVVDYFHSTCLSNAINYIDLHYEDVIKEVFHAIENSTTDLLFVETREIDLYTFVTSEVHKKFSKSDMTTLLKPYTDSCTNIITTQRKEFIQSATLNDNLRSNTFNIQNAKSSVEEFMLSKSPLSQIEAIQDEGRKKRNRMSVISTVVGLFSGGLFFDGVDVIYSICSSKKESEKLSVYLEQLIETVYADEIKYVTDQCDNAFTKLSNHVKYSQEQMKQYVQENL